jgi:hypothetical protein
MKTRTILIILMALGAGLSITLVSGLYRETARKPMSVI